MRELGWILDVIDDNTFVKLMRLLEQTKLRLLNCGSNNITGMSLIVLLLKSY